MATTNNQQTQVPNSEPDILVLKVGTECVLADRIDPAIMTNCTVKFVEPDPELPGVVYYYLRANNEMLNDKIDPRFSWTYFEIICNADDHLCPVALIDVDSE